MPSTYESQSNLPSRPKRRWTLMAGYNDPNQLAEEELYKLLVGHTYSKDLQDQANRAAMERLASEQQFRKGELNEDRNFYRTNLATQLEAQKRLAEMGYAHDKSMIGERIKGQTDFRQKEDDRRREFLRNAGVSEELISTVLSDVPASSLIDAAGLPQRIADEPRIAKKQGEFSIADLVTKKIVSENEGDEAHSYSVGDGPRQLGMSRAMIEPKIPELKYSMLEGQRTGQSIANAANVEEMIDRMKTINEARARVAAAKTAQEKENATIQLHNLTMGKGINYPTQPKNPGRPSGGSMVSSFGGGPSAGLSNTPPATATAPTAPLTAPKPQGQTNGLVIDPKTLELLKLINLPL